MVGKSFLLFAAATVIVGAFFVLGTSSAYAYAIPSTGQPLGGRPSPSPTSSGVDSTYNFNGSFQNLISPFQNFIQSLKWNTSTSMVINPVTTTVPVINISSTLQNTISQPFADFDNWFYGLTGVRLSGIVVVILSIISWGLSFILGVVNWLLGLFH